MKFRHYTPVFRVERLIYKRKSTQYQVRVSKQSAENHKKSVSPILVTVTSRCESSLEHSKIRFYKTKLDGMEPSSDRLNYDVRNN